MTKEKIETNYNSIDVFKLIMAIVVISLHTGPLNGMSGYGVEICNCLSECAVPFFFLSSGFLLEKKQVSNECYSTKVILKYLIKIIRLYVCWSVIYLPLAIWNYIYSGKSVAHCFFVYVRDFFFLGEHYNSWMLWYLLSTIYALILVILLRKVKVSNKGLACVGICVFLLSIGIDYLNSYEANLPEVLSMIKKLVQYTIVKGRILRSAFYIPIGMVMASRRIKGYLSWIMFLVAFIINIYINNNYLSVILVAICSIGLFGIIIDIRCFNRQSEIYSLIRNMSSVIYFIHMYIWTFYYKIVYNEKTWGLDSFFVTLIVCLMISFIYTRARRRGNKVNISLMKSGF